MNPYANATTALTARLPRKAPPRSRLAQAALEARRTRSGFPLWRHTVHGLGALGSSQVRPPAAWQTNPAALLALAKAAQKSLKGYASPGLGALGFSPLVGEAGSAVGSKVAATGATSFATYLGAGAAAGPIGIAAGAVIAIAVSLLTKNYFNVNQSNAVCAQVQSAWQKYLTIQGHVAGRALGWKTMVVVFHGAVGSGLFPGNDMHLQFHEGTLQCAGHGDWVDSFLGQTLQGNPVGCGAHNCMPDALQKFNHGNVPAGTPDAIYFVDSILLPMNQGDKIPWITNGAQNPQVHQLLYDLADAYLAQNTGGTTPYVEYPAAQAGTPTAGAEAAPSAAGTSAASAPAAGVAVATTPATSANVPAAGVAVATTPATSANVPAAGAAVATTPATSANVPAAGSGPVQVGTDPTTGLPIYQVPGQSQLYQLVNGSLVPYAPAQSAAMQSAQSYAPAPTGYYQAPTGYYQAPAADTGATAPVGSTGAITTGGFQMNTSTMLLLGGGLVVAFILSYMGEKGRFAAAKREKKH
jgi:hypothetical protein